MKIRTMLTAGVAGGVGYVLGAKAGRERYEQLKTQATGLFNSPQVQQTVTKVTEQTKETASTLADQAKSKADEASSKTGDQGSDALAGTAPVAADLGTPLADSGLGGTGYSDTGLGGTGYSDTGLSGSGYSDAGVTPIADPEVAPLSDTSFGAPDATSVSDPFAVSSDSTLTDSSLDVDPLDEQDRPSRP